YTTRTITILLDDFLSSKPVGDTGLSALEVVRRCFDEPEALRPELTKTRLTEQVAEIFQHVAMSLKSQFGQYDPAIAGYPRTYERQSDGGLDWEHVAARISLGMRVASVESQ